MFNVTDLVLLIFFLWCTGEACSHSLILVAFLHKESGPDKKGGEQD